MITHTKILEMWEEDWLNVSLSRSLTSASSKIPKIHHKYLQILIGAKANKIHIGHKIESLRKDLGLYYSGQATAEVYKKKPFPTKLKSRAAIEQHVNTDSHILSERDKIEYLAVIIEATEYILKQIAQQNFVIKNMIDIEKFRSGIN